MASPEEFPDTTQVQPLGAAPPGDAAWDRIEADPEFRDLVHSKRRFLVPATVFFIVYYFALPVLVGYFPEVMDRPVAGSVNLAYLFALSQFFMAWIVMWVYVRRARGFDAQAARVVARARGGAA
ncbi:MAG: DUF485 domain-containing protein [Gemmatimonadetes bacterium]|nr:DUF485 domain-containing protein [Gemmatimonadota bacterium]